MQLDRRSSPAWLPAALLLTLTCSFPALAVDQASPRDAPFAESFDVTVANVEVFVTDRKGNPVAGLTREDFELFEDGRKVEIVNFFAQSEDVAEAGMEPAEEEAPAAAAPRQGRTIGVFLDNRNLELAARARFFDSLRPFLLERAPEDRILFIVYDRALQVRRLKGNDRIGIQNAVAEILSSGTGASELRMERDTIVRDIELSRESQTLDSAYAAIRLYAEKRLRETQASLDALDQSARILSGMPGHKVLLYASNGLDLRPAERLFEMLAAREASLGVPGISQNIAGNYRLQSFSFDATPNLRRVIDRANAGRVTFYAIGLPLGGEAEIRTSIQSAEIRGGEAFHQEAAMRDLAGGTGGTAVFDPANPGLLLNQITRDLATFYSLGYTPRPGKVGQNRNIRVKVRQPGLAVRYRETFRTKEPEEATRERLLSALHMGEFKNPLGLAVDFAPVKQEGSNKLKLDVTIKFPLSRLALLPSETGPRGLARLFIVSRDDKGGVSEITEVAIPIRVPRDQAEQALLQSAGYKTSLLIRDEATVLAFALRDEQGNTDSTLVVKFLPPPPPGHDVRMARKPG